MTTTYAVSREIDAQAQVIWDLLTNAAGYPEWNPSVIAIDGEIAEGNRIALSSTVSPNRQFNLKVSEVQPPHRMVWSSGMPLGLFKGVRTFEVAANEDGTSTFSMEEVYSGVMEPLISKSIPDLDESFKQFGDGLKTAAESI